MASGLHAGIVQMWRDEPWHSGEACSCSRLEFSAALHDQLPAKYARIFECILCILVYSSPLRHCLEYYATMLLRADFERGYLSDSESLGSSKSSGNSLPRASKSMAKSGAGLVRSPFFRTFCIADGLFRLWRRRLITQHVDILKQHPS